MKHQKIYYGVVESRDADPLKLGRCKVRVVGVHIEDAVLLKTKDLPWAYPLMPVHSASMSGIGYSPTGIVEGTWVAITFRDEYMQHPIIIGSVGGIPEDPEILPAVNTVTYTVTKQDQLMDSSGTPVVDGSGMPVLVGTPKTEVVTEAALPPTDIKKASSLTISEAGIQFIMDREAVSSLTKGKNDYTFRTLDPNTPLYSYQDSGAWAIGYGSTILTDGSKVDANTTILFKDAKTLLNRHISTEIESKLKGKLVAPVTQQMYDAMIDMAYNGGVYGLMSSNVFSSVNTGKYKDAATLIPFWKNTVKGVVNKGLINRRNRQQELFLSGGIPNAAFTDVDKDEPAPVPVVQPATNTSATAPNQGTTASGSNVTETATTNEAHGFKDPNGKYPIKTMINEPDTHRLARSERIHESIVFAKEAGRARKIRKANWIKIKKDWSQPEIPYNAKYPFNQTRVTESGHVEEWDDTKDNERIHKYHKSGTFEEIDRNGTRVTRIVGDNYEILERNGNLVVKGAVTINIVGNADIRCENNLTMEVLGNMSTRVGGDYDVWIQGNMKFHAEKSIKMETFAGIAMHADGDINVGAVGNITESARRIDFNPGGPPSSIKVFEEWEEKAGIPEFGELIVIPRTIEDSTNYESPVEGDSTVFREHAVKRGDMSKDDAVITPDEKPTIVTVTPPPPLDVTKTPTVPVKEDSIDEINRNMQLSPNYKLGDLMGTGAGVPTDQAGVTAKQAVANLKWIANNVLEPIRAKYPNIVVTSGWRSEGRNAGITGASKTSDHLKGGAVDIVFPGLANKQLVETAGTVQSMIPTYKQILVEYKGNSKWVHVGVYGPGAGIANTRTIGTMDVDLGPKGTFYPGVFRTR